MQEMVQNKVQTRITLGYSSSRKPENMCHICGKNFSTEKILEKHVKQHSEKDVKKAEILQKLSEAEKAQAENKEKEKNREESGSSVTEQQEGITPEHQQWRDPVPEDFPKDIPPLEGEEDPYRVEVVQQSSEEGNSDDSEEEDDD